MLVLYLTVTYYTDLVDWFGPDPVFEYLLLFSVSFFAGTVLLSPDLDLPDSDPAKSWGILRVIWRPYARVFKHRGLSHAPVLGTLTRVMYLCGVLYIAATVARSLVGFELPVSAYDWPMLVVPETACVMAGLVGADLIHLVADRLFKP